MADRDIVVLMRAGKSSPIAGSRKGICYKCKTDCHIAPSTEDLINTGKVNDPIFLCVECFYHQELPDWNDIELKLFESQIEEIIKNI